MASKSYQILPLKPQVRVAFLGNVNNNWFLLCRMLLKEALYHPTLFVGKEEPYINHPISDLPDFDIDSCTWVENIGWLEMRLIRYFPNLCKTKSKLRDYDYCLLSSDYLPLAKVIKVPCIFFPSGADLTRLPFPSLDEQLRKPFTLKWLTRKLMGKNQRDGILSCKKITSSVFPPFAESLERLGVHKNDPKLTKTYLPLIMDLDLFSPSLNSEWPEELKNLRKDSEFIVFSPSRIIDIVNPTRIRVGSWKNTSALVHGFKIFLNSCALTFSENIAPKLVFIDRSYSPDIQKIKDLIGNLDLEKNVIWLRADNSEGFTRNQLRHFYTACDVVADDFGVGWFGGVALEGLAFNKDVITHVPDKLMNSLFGSNPFSCCKEPNEIALQLSRLYDLNVNSVYIPNTREWLEETQNPEVLLKVFKQILDEVNS